MPIQQHGHQLSCNQPGDKIYQYLGHYISPQSQYLLSGRGQTRISPKRCRDALSPLRWSHVHAHRGGTRLHLHRHRPVALARIYVLHSATDIIFHHRCLCVYEPSALVLTPLGILPSTNPTQHSNCTFTKPRPIHLIK